MRIGDPARTGRFGSNTLLFLSVAVDLEMKSGQGGITVVVPTTAGAALSCILISLTIIAGF
jgi:hypothetical protein